MKILLTGAGGQLGQAITAEAAGLDLWGLPFPDLDITDLDAIREAIKGNAPDILINCAAFTKVDAAEADSVSAYRVNALGPRNLALATSEAGIPILHISTDYVFDGSAEQPLHEYDRTGPLSVYGQSKLAGELAIISLNPRHYIVRTAWLYHHSPGRAGNFPLTMIKLATQGEVRVVSDQYGSPTYAPHLARAIMTLIGTRAFGIWHLAGRGGTSWFDLTRTLYKALDIPAMVTPVSTADFPRPARRPRYTVLTSIQSPTIILPPWEEGVAEFAARLNNCS